MRLRPCVVLALAACLAAEGFAADDPLRADACRQALDALAQQERQLEARSRTDDALAGWRAAQRRAAANCLGREDAPRPQHLVQPVRVAPVVIPPAPVRSITVPAPTPGPLLPPNVPPTVTSCDPNGCWAADGTRLQRNGPDLVGPRGLCTLVGNVLRCP